MAIRKESAQVSAENTKLRNKKADDLIGVRQDAKEKGPQKNYEAGIDPQDEQLNTVPEGTGISRGDAKPGGGNRLHSDVRSREVPSPGKK